MMDELQKTKDTSPIVLSAAEFIELLETGKTKKYTAQSDYLYDIIIEGIEVTEAINITEGRFSKNINIKGGTFNQSFQISGDPTFQSFKISGGTFYQSFIISGDPTFQSFKISDGNFNQWFIISGGNFKQSFKIRGGNFNQWFIIRGGNFNLWFDIRGNSTFKSFKISSGTFNQSFQISGGTFEETLSIEGGSFNQGLSISTNTKPIAIKTLKLSDRFKDLLTIRNVLVDKLVFIDFENYGHIKIINVKKYKSGPHIVINGSSLGNTEIIGCNWIKGIMKVDDSKILDLFYSDTLFPPKIESREQEDKKNFEQRRDTYGQLKAVADRQNDRESSLNFQAALNREIYKLKRNQLIGTNRFLWLKATHFQWWKWWAPEWFDWLQLFLSKWSNNFGTSYGRALGCIFVFGVLFFSLYIPFTTSDLAYTKYILQWPSGFWYGLTNHYGDFFGFLNPARTLGYMCPKDPISAEKTCDSQVAIILDWSSRLVLAYLIYQFVGAFRKYGRR